MNKSLQYLISLLSAIALTGCEKELDFEYRDIDPILVIEGTLTSDGTEVSLTMTTPMDEPMDRTRLIDATITLTDLTDATSSILNPGKDNVYRSATSGTTGHTYQLNVERNGHSYRSTSTMLLPTKIIALEFQWIKMPYDHVAILQISFEDNQQTTGECYWIRTYRNGEPYKWSIVTDLGSVDGRIDEILMTTRKDTDEEDDEDVLFDGDIVSVSVTPISRDFYDYLEALGADSNGPAMFEGDFCLGYFLASTPDCDSITFHPDEIPNYTRSN